MENAMQKPLIAVLVASVFLSLDARAADLIQVYQQAMANDAVYASARAAVAAGREKTPQGRSLLLPTIGVTGQVSSTNSLFAPAVTLPDGGTTGGTTGGTPSTGLLGGGGTFRTNQWTISLSQPLFRWANWQSYEQSKLQQAAAEATFAQAQQDLITRVAQAYFDVLAAQDTLESTRAEKASVTEQLASAKRNFEVGTQTITDTHEAQAAYDLVVSREFAAINDLDVRRAALQAIVGNAPATLAPLKQGVTLTPPQPSTMDPWIASAENQNYGVVAQQLNLEIAKREISRQRAGHYPTLDLVANKVHTNVDGFSSRAGIGNDKAVGLSWSVPIFNGFAVTSRVRESIALEDKARNDLESTRRNATLGVRQAFLGVNSGLAQVKALEAAEVSTQSALESNKLGYQVGVRINIDVLNAQRQVYTTRTQLALARYNTIMNGLRLKAAAGSLKEADLIPVNNLLQK
jgi:outer membrane protein